MKLLGHPSNHGHHVNPHECGAGLHRTCSGFSGGHDTYICGCCCHDDYYPELLTEQDRALIGRLRGEAS